MRGTRRRDWRDGRNRLLFSFPEPFEADKDFTGLLIWCFYCDWMTGVWSLGTEILRNVESFWCPIRFSCDKKCENCLIDFPDVKNGWVPATGTMKDVVETLDRMYPTPEGSQPWFGHPMRKSTASPAGAEAESSSNTPDSKLP